jgi:ectoine hydroxylase-related dioxygenase (phytanoyl-CoA dioxygenase family)
MALRVLQASASLGDVKAELDQRGFAVVEGFASESLMDRLTADAELYFAQSRTLGGAVYGDAFKKVHGMVAKSGAVIELLSNPMVRAIAEAVLGVDPVIYACGAFRIEKGSRPQTLHLDETPYRPILPRVPGGTEYVLNIMYAMTEFTAENGGTCMVTGSHLWDDRREPTDDDEIVKVEMPKGSIAIWRGSLWHGAGQNLTDVPRTGLQVGFNAGFLRSYENQMLLVPPAYARYLPTSVRELIGYHTFRGMLGSLDEKSPMEALGMVPPLLQESKEAEAPVAPDLLETAVRDHFASTATQPPREVESSLMLLAAANAELAAATPRWRESLAGSAAARARTLIRDLVNAGISEPVDRLLDHGAEPRVGPNGA